MSFIALEPAPTSKPSSSFVPIGQAPSSIQPTLITRASNFFFGTKPAPVDISQPFTTPFTKENTALAVSVANQIKEAYQGSVQQQKEGVALIQNGGALGGLEGGLKYEAGTVGAIFSPLAPLTNLIGKGIDAAGGLLSDTRYLKGYGEDVANLPQEQTQFPALLSALQDLGTIAMGILGAKTGEIKDISPAKMTEIAHNPEIIDAASKVTEAQRMELTKPTPSFTAIKSEVPVESLNRATETSASPMSEYEPYIPSEQLPVIQMGAKPKSSLPTIQTEVPNELPAPAGMKIEPIKSPIQISPRVGETQLQSASLQEAIDRVTEIKPETIKVPSSQLPVGKGETAVSRLEARVTENLNNLTSEAIDKIGLSTYEKMNKAEQIRAASEYVTKNPDHILAILKGDKEPPAGILKNSIYVAAENMAHDDVGLARKLASLESTRAGQELSILSEVNHDSPVKALRTISEARIIALKGKKIDLAKEKVSDTSKFKSEVKASRSSRASWEEFAKEIACNY